MDLDGPAARSPAMMQARTLADWVGAGRAVTAGGVVRRADVPGATAAIGHPHKRFVRSAADLPTLHDPWCAARGARLITVADDGRATASEPTGPPTEQWLGGLRAVLRARSADARRVGASLLCEIVLELSATADRHTLAGHTTDRLGHRDARAAWDSFGGVLRPDAAAAELLAWFGALDGSAPTALGEWARGRLVGPDPTASTAGPPVDPETSVLQIAVRLDRVRPPVWRRLVLDPDTTLGALHEIIQAAFEWDNDHLHVFEVEGRSYGDPFHDLFAADDENEVTLAGALPSPKSRLRYTYDLGDCWVHTATLEKVLDRATAGPVPACTGGRNAAPVEDWCGDEDEREGTEFDAERITRALAARWSRPPRVRRSAAAPWPR